MLLGMCYNINHIINFAKKYVDAIERNALGLSRQVSDLSGGGGGCGGGTERNRRRVDGSST